MHALVSEKSSLPSAECVIFQRMNSSVTRADLAQAESQIMASPPATPGLTPLLSFEGVTSGIAANALCSLMTATKREF